MTISCAMGCRSAGWIYTANDHSLANDSHQLHQTNAAFTTVSPDQEVFAGLHSIEECLEIGLTQNPEILEARLMVESLAHRIPQAASLPDPNLGATLYPSPVQTAAGEQEFGLSIKQKVPWQGKLATRVSIARQDVKAARANLSAIELKIAEQIRNAYFKLAFVQQSIDIITRDKEQLQLIENVVDQMHRVQQEVTQQDILQVQVQLSQIELELLELKQQKTSAQARLARLLHVSTEASLEAMEYPSPQQTLQDIQLLYELAIESRPELHAQLALIDKDRRATCLAELQNYPDITLGLNWISTSNDGISPVANGDDALMLTMGLNLPIYKRRIDAGVREARTRALANAHKYNRLKDETVEGVADLFAKIRSQQETLRFFRDDILPKTRLTLDQSIDDYQVGKVDFLQMIDNWRRLLRFRVAEKRFEMDLQQSLASLARQVGSLDLPTGSRNDAAKEQPQP